MKKNTGEHVYESERNDYTIDDLHMFGAPPLKDHLREKYAELIKSGTTANEFGLQLCRDGIRPYHTMMYLVRSFSLGLNESKAICVASQKIVEGEGER